MKQMKKYTALLLLAAIVFSLTACSEPKKESAPAAAQAPQSTLACDFPLHCGVTFGMTRDEVIKKEEAAGFQMVKDMLTPAKAAEKAAEIEKGPIDLTKIGAEEPKTPKTDIDCFYDEAHLPDLYGSGTFAGIESSDIAYWFNDQGQLFRMQYSLDCWETTEQDMQLILNSLMKKYGEPTYSSEKNTALPCVANGYPVTYSGWQLAGGYTAPAFWNPEETMSVAYEIANTQDVTWVIPDEKDSYVTVVNHSFSEGESNCSGDSGWFPAWLITYTRLPKADFENSLTTPSGSASMTSVSDDL